MSARSHLTPAAQADGEVPSVVVGGGIAGLAAAYDLAAAGLRPVLLEARGYTGGLVAGATIGGVQMDLGAEGFVIRGQAVTSLADDLGLEVLGPSGGGARLFLPPPGGPQAEGPWQLHHFLRDAFLGIPADPGAEDVVALLGAQAAARAAQDAVMGGQAGSRPQDPADLASFVRTRMGQAVLDRLVRPIVAGIHTADPSELAADTVAPGLREATTRLGSLQAAVAELLERRRARQRGGGAADVTTRGGLVALTDAMRVAITAAGGRVETRRGAQSLRMRTEGSSAGPVWELRTAPTGPGHSPSAEPVPTGPEGIVRTRRLVLACSAGAALRLLGGVEGVDTAVEVPVGSPIARYTVVLRAPALDQEPVGSGLLVAPVGPGQACPVRAKALSHLSVKWPWIAQGLRERHGPEVHALRLSYGRPGEPRPQVSIEDALEDVATLTGVRATPEDVIDSMLVRWDGTLPPVTPAYRARTARLLREVATHPGLEVTGAWVAGTGIAAVVEHARAAARRLGAHSTDSPVSGSGSARVSGGTEAP